MPHVTLALHPPRLAAFPAAFWRSLALAILAPLCAVGCTAVHGTEPNVRVLETTLTDLSFDGVTVLMDVEVNNPSKAPLPIERMDYGLTLGQEGVPVTSGAVEAPAMLKPKSAVRLEVPARIAFVDLLAHSMVARPGAVVPYVASVSVESRDAEGGTLDLDGQKEGELPVPMLPQVVVKDVTWVDSGVLGMKGTVLLGITNPNAFPIDLKRMKWKLALNGKEVVSSKVSPQSFAAGATDEVVIPISVSTLNLGRSMFALSSGGAGSYEFSADVRIKTPYGELGGPITRSAAAR